ncbi:MAG: sodium:proton antiporter [Bacteroidota bacterium]
MTIPAIITLCILLLISYIFHLTAAKTNIPAVILLLLLGWIMRQFAIFFDIQLPGLQSFLPVLGTIGLILIVLEGAFELDMHESKIPFISKSFVTALVPLIFASFALSYFFQWYGMQNGEVFSLKQGLLNAIPLCIISSAIAIPSAQNLSRAKKEFVIYESSLSDIFGVIFFNFIAFNTIFDFYSFAHFGFQILIIIIVTFIATISLSLLLSKIKNHIKFVPIIILIILIYSVSKYYHLPALVFILMFGLFIGNVTKLFHFKWAQHLRPDILEKEVSKFTELTSEATFVIRSLFFLLFGYLLETDELLNPDTFVWAVAIVGGIYFIRGFMLLILRIPIKPLIYIYPKGLITILLFLTISENQSISFVNGSLIIQIILLSSFVMMFGIMFYKRDAKELEEIERFEKEYGDGDMNIEEDDGIEMEVINTKEKNETEDSVI